MFDIACRPGLARLTDWQSIGETMILLQYNAIVPRSGWKVLDIGCSIGDYAIWATRKGAHVIAYECDRFCFPALRRNAVHWGFQVIEKRVTDLRVLPPADLIKVDIEGGEADLKGWTRFQRIILEYHEPYYDSRALETCFLKWGYQVKRSPNRHRADIGIMAAWR